MKGFGLGSYVISGGVALALLSGCGASQPPSVASPSATLQGRAIATRSAHRGSWMLPEATQGDLIYATGACGGTCILSYPDGTLVGSLNVGDGGACSDTSGNVYIASENSLFEFAHGGDSPVKTFTVSGGVIDACSVDPTTGNVAVAVGQLHDYDVAVFPSGSGSPTTYVIDFDIQFCGYDNSGNLFVDGYGDGSGESFSLYELTKLGTQFANISISPSLPVRPGQVQWDGKYITVEGLGINTGVAMYRLAVSGSTASVVKTINFKGVTRVASQSWIEGKLILIPYGTTGNGIKKTKVGIWKYPAGGEVLQKISHFERRPDVQAVTFSKGS